MAARLAALESSAAYPAAFGREVDLPKTIMGYSSGVTQLDLCNGQELRRWNLMRVEAAFKTLPQ